MTLFPNIVNKVIPKSKILASGLVLLCSCGDDLDLHTRGALEIDNYFYEFYELNRGRENYLVKTSLDSTYQMTFADMNNSRKLDGFDDKVLLYEDGRFRMIRHEDKEFPDFNKKYIEAQETIIKYRQSQEKD